MEMEQATDPIALFEAWFAAASLTEREANAMALATATADGVPSVRMVLLKGVDSGGFVFYTNLESRKGSELAANSHAALCFHWVTPEHRQVRVEGVVEAVTNLEADAYYQSRARDSRVGAWASIQSQPLDSRQTLEARVAEVKARFGASEISRPPFWSGFRVVPRHIEFWQERPFRLHDRIRFNRSAEKWAAERLYP